MSGDLSTLSDADKKIPCADGFLIWNKRTRCDSLRPTGISVPALGCRYDRGAFTQRANPPSCARLCAGAKVVADIFENVASRCCRPCWASACSGSLVTFRRIRGPMDLLDVGDVMDRFLREPTPASCWFQDTPNSRRSARSPRCASLHISFLRQSGSATSACSYPCSPFLPAQRQLFSADRTSPPGPDVE